ncbi:flagellar basal body P-ring formation chaperone FlgA [Shewanella surugensis]|uniref:Flagella basal body P-ring formation protein FlgA n=1 Tax=Shewanella surugensis TaxID=212020 RepID=A0ABT0LIU4_9GAMM|nr:flagellar basal body P-ring formation chaperone FlgA [Shewanella surugensis]MCL1127624.1 flagellar basal body P-ring formation protein FlgA [Shewanella surugensis]
MKVKYCIYVLFLLLPISVAGQNIATVPSLSALSQIAIAAVEKKIVAPESAKVRITPQKLHSAQYIPACLGAIEAKLATDRDIKRNNTVKITCHSPDLDYPWQLFVSVRVDILFPVIVTTSLFGPGHIIGKNDVKIAYIEKNSLRGQQLNHLTDVIGAKLKRRTPAGSPLFGSHFCLVCQDDAVTIIAHSANLTIKTQGQALSDGNLGDNINVRNHYTQKKFNAYVTSAGQVEVRL